MSPEAACYILQLKVLLLDLIPPGVIKLYRLQEFGGMVDRIALNHDSAIFS